MTVLVLTKMATNWPVKEKQYELILKKKKRLQLRQMTNRLTDGVRHWRKTVKTA